MADFNVNLRGVGLVSIIDVKGYLDAHTAPELENVFNKLLEDKHYQVVVNFNDLKYISSAGLGVFMAYVETMRENKGDIKFSNMKESVYNLFHSPAIEFQSCFCDSILSPKKEPTRDSN